MADLESAKAQLSSGADPEIVLQALEEKAKKYQDAFEKEEKLRKEYEETNNKLTSEMAAMRQQLDGEKGSLAEYQEKALKLGAQKMDLESQLAVSKMITTILSAKFVSARFWKFDSKFQTNISV